MHEAILLKQTSFDLLGLIVVGTKHSRFIALIREQQARTWAALPPPTMHTDGFGGGLIILFYWKGGELN
jgi:hypothetical protein